MFGNHREWAVVVYTIAGFAILGVLTILGLIGVGLYKLTMMMFS